MLLETDKLKKGRVVYVVVRGGQTATVEQYVIKRICKDEHSHYLHVLPTNASQEPLNVQISGVFLPETILTNTVFFDPQEARYAMHASNLINRGGKYATPDTVGEDVTYCQNSKSA